MTKEDITRILEENEKRKAVLFAPYNPVTGTGSPIDRVPVTFYAGGNKFTWNIPKSMYKVHKDLIDQLNKTGSLLEVMASVGPITSDMEAILRFIELRFKYDFEFWVYVTCRITDKRTKQTIPFKLNRPQRKVVVAFEKMRLALKPIRAIIDKARQWGGSTVIQAYMLWIQQIHKTAWHSSIVTAVEDQARAVRGKYSDMAKNYPAEFGKITLAPFEGSSKQRFVVERECIIGIGSAEKPDSLRTHDFAMCHFSESAFFKSTTTKSAEDLVQNLRATIPDVPYALEVLESTAKGVGNFFHREWLAAKSGESGYVPIFVAWHEIEMYQLKIKDYTRFIEWMVTDTYAQFLWSLGATLEGINWYFTFKKAKHYDNWRMMNEFPSSWQESFSASDKRVFSPFYVQNARKNNTPPEFIGELKGKSHLGKEALEGLEFQKDPKGKLWIWMMPDNSIKVSDRYVVSVDIGGRWAKADYSVIRVFDRYWMTEPGGIPEVVATWRGHLDQDLVAWVAAQIAKFYNNALLIVESNSLDKDEETGERGGHFLTILDELVKFYPNIYARTDPEKIRQGLPIKYGFQTNITTKPMVVDLLNAVLREEGYIERDERACNEMDTYEIKESGSYGAVAGCKDDLVMSTAIGLWCALKFMPLPKVIEQTQTRPKKRIISEATI